jgi:hypothetical protein
VAGVGHLRRGAVPAGFIAPCLPTKVPQSPSGDAWLHESSMTASASSPARTVTACGSTAVRGRPDISLCPNCRGAGPPALGYDGGVPRQAERHALAHLSSAAAYLRYRGSAFKHGFDAICRSPTATGARLMNRPILTVANTHAALVTETTFSCNPALIRHQPCA